MDILILLGRVLFVPLFLASGYGHLTQTDAMAGYAQSRGIPFARAAVFGSGVVMVVASALLLFGVWPDLAALLLFLFLLPTALLTHQFWKETDASAKQQEMIQCNKDLALAGASLMLFALFVKADEELGLTLTGPLF